MFSSVAADFGLSTIKVKVENSLSENPYFHHIQNHSYCVILLTILMDL